MTTKINSSVIGTITDFTVTGNLTVQGNTYFTASNNLTINNSIIELHTFANLAPLTSNDGRDIGLKMHYYDTQDSHAFLGRANDTGYLEWYNRGIEGSGNVFQGNAYGTIKTGELVLSNITVKIGRAHV